MDTATSPTLRAAGASGGAFGALLRRWRQARGTSQLDLALACDTSQRHLSFLESGRARPSRGMVLTLAGALAVPLRHQDALLLAAGFAPMFGPRAADAPELQPVRSILDRMLDQQMPFPAVVVDRHYTLVQANPATLALMIALAGGPPPAAAGPPNLVRLLFSSPVVERLRNLPEVAGWTVRRLRAEALLEDPLSDGGAFLNDLLTLPALSAHARSDPFDVRVAPPLLTLDFALEGANLSLMTVIASLGTPLDAGLQDLRVELFFPADAETEDWFRRA